MSSGGIVDDILAGIAHSDPGELPPSDATAASLLPINVIKYIKHHLKNNDISNNAPDCVVFVQPDIPRAAAKEHDHTKHLCFKVNDELNIQGKVFLVAPDLHVGYSIDQSFSGIDDTTTWLSENKFDSSPTIIVSLKQKVIYWYPEGIENEDQFGEYFVDDVNSIDKPKLDTLLDQFHDKHVASPSALKGNLSIWSDSGKCIPCKDLEKTIQELLKISLCSRFPESIVVDEVSSSAGRYDLMIYTHQGKSTFLHFALLELKAFRTFSFPKKDKPTKYNDSKWEQAVKDGLVQTYKYKDKFKAKFGFLCCYDARQKPSKEIMNVVEADAEDKGIELRHYPLFNSAKAYRDA